MLCSLDLRNAPSIRNDYRLLYNGALKALVLSNMRCLFQKVLFFCQKHQKLTKKTGPICINSASFQNRRRFASFLRDFRRRFASIRSTESISKVLKVLKVLKVIKVIKVIKVLKALKVLKVFRVLKALKVLKVHKVLRVLRVLIVLKVIKVIKVLKVLKVIKVLSI